MLICPNCKNQEISGSLFCSNCGAQLHDQSEENGNPTDASSNPNPHEMNSAKALPTPKKEFDSPIVLHFLNTGEDLPLGKSNEFTLGRATQNQPIVPDVDLSPYEAYEAGVSRLHATIRIEKDKVILIDLGSVNGTRIEGKRLTPHLKHTIRDGDVISLGKMKLKVRIKA